VTPNKANAKARRRTNQLLIAVVGVVAWAGGSTPPSDKSLSLLAQTIVWFFTTSDRFVRDRATKALVALLSGGHLLLIGVPGLAKTKLVETLERDFLR